MEYTDKQYQAVLSLVMSKRDEVPMNQMMLLYRWFSIASNIHDVKITKAILWDIVMKHAEN